MISNVMQYLTNCSKMPALCWLPKNEENQRFYNACANAFIFTIFAEHLHCVRYSVGIHAVAIIRRFI